MVERFNEVAREATTLTPIEFESFLVELEHIPSSKAPINGQVTRLCFEFMEDTGCRVNEIIHVKKKDVDFSTRILTVTMPKTEKACKCSTWKNKDSYSRTRVLEYADPKCNLCHGKGRWKKPQTTTFTHRVYQDLLEYCNKLNDEDLLFPISRQSLWEWSKLAGKKAGINIFQQKDEIIVKGIFLHLFRALCSKRMTEDAKDDAYTFQLVARKLRHSYERVTDRYTKIDINYLLTWEEKTYHNIKRELVT